ncbi:MAG: FAD-dependent oxidoreductase, partial [Synergistaceae bacterium]|nr:FAD-dependent oxidoreductase [Synergistaceae bacterium]
AVKFSPSISAFISRITYTYTPNADINDAFWTNSYNFYTQSPNGYYLGTQQADNYYIYTPSTHNYHLGSQLSNTWPSSMSAKISDTYDIIIAGGGIGGISAAIQASRMGASVLVVEKTNWLGGQATAAGVSNMDDLSEQMSGLYLEFMSRIEEYYALRGKSINTTYWEISNKAFEPSIGKKILQDMAKGENAPDILYFSEVVAVDKYNETINSVIIQTPEGKRNIACKILIDATEYGDILPLAGADYRAGNSVTPSINLETMIQDITWTAIIRKYPDGVPERLRPKNPLPGYDHAKWNYQRYVTKDGADFMGVYPVKLPVNFVTHNAYRGLPDSFLPGNYDAHKRNWPKISKTSVNWGNDYPGYYMWKNKYGLPVEYLEDKTLRARVERDALIKTLHFIYYVQNELGENWSVDENEYNYLPEAAKDLPREWQEVARHMPPIPYVRESRRLVGLHTLTSEELYKNSLGHEIDNSIAVGRYALDLHHSDTDNCMEKDLGEKAAFIQEHEPQGNFQVPMDILIPVKVDGLIAAEKNLSMSRLAAGALRLQPICMMTGQAAGVLAALSVQKGIPPREVKYEDVRRVLIEAGVNLSLKN